MAWQKLTSKVADATTSFTTDVFDEKTFIQLLLYVLSASGSIEPRYRVGKTSADTGTNYANRSSTDGGAESTEASASSLKVGLSASVNSLNVGYGINIAAEEKLFIDFCVAAGGVGASNAPSRKESVGKWTNTSNPFDIVNVSRNVGGPTFDLTDTELSILGTD